MLINHKLSLSIESHFWGNSPAVDLHKLLPLGREFLISGAGDCRHLLATWAADHLEGESSNFTLASLTAEMMARDMLLLSIALESSRSVEERLTFFLELHGNCFLQEKTKLYLKDICSHLVEMIAQEKSPLLKVFDISRLRNVERNMIVNIFKFWSSQSEFDIGKHWNARMRSWYGDKFDHRKNLVNWDYVSRLKPVAPIINSDQYKRWREFGNAFEIRDCTYSYPNRTLSSNCKTTDKEKMKSNSTQGYWSDIVNPPWISFGIKSSDKKMFRIERNEHRWTAVDVCQSNVKQWIWFLAARSGQVSGQYKPFRDFSTKADLKSRQDHEQQISKKDCMQDGHIQNTPKVKFYHIANTVPGRVTFICGGLEHKVFKRPGMLGKFDLCLIGWQSDFGVDTSKIMRCSESSIVLVETPRYLITFTDQEKTQAAEKYRKIGRGFGWTLEKDISEPPKVPGGNLNDEMYWLDNEDTLDAYLIWKPTRDEVNEKIGTELACGEKAKSFYE